VATSSLETGGGKPEPQMRAEVVFLLLDGLRRTSPSGPSEVVLCALGLTREGTPHPLGLRVVPQEDERTWRALLGDLKADGVGPDLLLICSDGHPALIKAIHATYPETPVQISVAHRLLALARKVDARWRAACLAEVRKIFTAPDRADAVVLFREWHARWLNRVNSPSQPGGGPGVLSHVLSLSVGPLAQDPYGQPGGAGLPRRPAHRPAGGAPD